MIPRIATIHNGNNCPYSHETSDYDDIGSILKSKIICEIEHKECLKDEIPIWCPLPSVPVKLPEEQAEDKIKSAIWHGWNLCTDCILESDIDITKDFAEYELTEPGKGATEKDTKI